MALWKRKNREQSATVRGERKAAAFLIARYRSGTGALGSLLDRHEATHYCREVLHPDETERATNFLGFENQKFAARELRHPYARRELFFGPYLEHVRACVGGRLPVVDVKYNSMHLLDPYWHDYIESPGFLGEVKRRKLPIIHLKRRNHLAQLVSNWLAGKSGIFHVHWKDELPKLGRIRVSPEDVLRRLHIHRNEERAIDSVLEGYEALCTLHYEDLFDEAELGRPGPLGDVSSILGIPPFSETRPGLRKQTSRRLRECIDNYDELCAALAGTAYAWMAPPA